jgi:hypothetical protein
MGEKENDEIIGVIDAMLTWPVSGSTKENLRSFKAQAEAGTLQNDDRKYVIALGKRLLRSRNGSHQYPSLGNTSERTAKPNYGDAVTNILGSAIKIVF